MWETEQRFSVGLTEGAQDEGNKIIIARCVFVCVCVYVCVCVRMCAYVYGC